MVDYYRHGKAQLLQRARQQTEADHARRRFEAREQRLTREAMERKQRLDQRQLSSDGEQKKYAIAAAIARAKQRGKPVERQ